MKRFPIPCFGRRGKKADNFIPEGVLCPARGHCIKFCLEFFFHLDGLLNPVNQAVVVKIGIGNGGKQGLGHKTAYILGGGLPCGLQPLLQDRYSL